MIVVIQVVGGSLIGGKPFERRSIHNENIRPSVIVIVKDGHARPGGLNDVFLGIDPAKYIHCGQPCFFRDVDEICDAGLVGAFWRRSLRRQGAAEQQDDYGWPKHILDERSQ